MEIPPPPPPPPPPSATVVVERSKRLHNFTLPYLRWGQQRFLRCVKLPRHQSPSSSSSPDHTVHRSPSLAAGGGGGELKVDLSKPNKVSSLGEAKNGDSTARPWNLRTRRAACNEPGDEPARIIIEPSPSLRGGGVSEKKKKKEKVKFCVALLREEIEEDFTTLIGKRPPRRPKKRPRLVQKQMNTLFPGLWLAEEVTADSYDAPDAADT